MTLRRLAVIVAAPLLAAGAIGAPPAAARSSTCESRHGDTVLQTRQARVFTRAGLDTAAVFACLRSSRQRSIALGELHDFDGGGLSQFRLAGPYLGFRDIVCDRYTSDCRSWIRMVDLRSRELLGRAFDVADWVMRRSGALAAIESADASQGWEVRRYDGDRSEVLDAGSDIEPDSLAASGTRVYWMRGGVPRSAPLP